MCLSLLPQLLFAQAPHLSVTQPGGMPGWPILTGVQLQESNQVEIIWDGPAGFYQLLQKPTVDAPSWQPVGSPNIDRTQQVPASNPHAFFSVLGPSPQYAGSLSCAACHGDVHEAELLTPHAHALETLKQIGQDTNPSCLPCHTVGYGLPTGFINETVTPNLAGVQCENCHGPAAVHAANPIDFSRKPRAELASTVCGGCHTGSHHPTYPEWKDSGHSVVSSDMNSSGRIEGCGRCHSGSSRLAQLDGVTGDDLIALVQGDANVPITCAVCHDPHNIHVQTNLLTALVVTNQLRNPTHSTNDYFITTSGALTNQYNPNVNGCAQCHNHRGAVWTDTRSPHRTPQYNMLLATVGEVPEGVIPWSATHAGVRFITNGLNAVIAVTNQCVTCHMQTEAHQNGPPEVAAITGHTFEVDSYKACLECHQPLVDPDRGEDLVEGLVELVTMVVDMEIEYTKILLDDWGANYSPEILRTNYGALSWEYTNGGDLSDGDGPPNGPEGQDQIPDAIKKARFNVYLVLYDGSLGVHNTFHALDLLKYAQEWVQEEMVPPEK